MAYAVVPSAVNDPEVRGLEHVLEQDRALRHLGQEEDLAVVAALLPGERSAAGVIEHLEAGRQRILDQHVLEVARRVELQAHEHAVAAAHGLELLGLHLRLRGTRGGSSSPA